MVKLVALYGKPKDPAHFDHYYKTVHVPLAKQIPDLKRFTIHKALASPQGGEPAYYCITEVYWDDLEVAQRAIASPAGQRSVADVPKYATGGVTFVYCDVEEVPLRPRAARAAGAGGGRGARAARGHRKSAARRKRTSRRRPA